MKHRVSLIWPAARAACISKLLSSREYDRERLPSAPRLRNRMELHRKGIWTVFARDAGASRIFATIATRYRIGPSSRNPFLEETFEKKGTARSKTPNFGRKGSKAP
jgi:hypothetical protein